MANLMRYMGVAGALTLGMTTLAWGCGDDDDTLSTSTTTASTGGNGGMGGSGAAGGSEGGMGGMGGSGGGAGGSIPSNCGMPIDISLGETVQGDTSVGTDTLVGPCQMGSDNEAVYRFTADATGTVDLTLTSTTSDLGLYIRTECEDPSTVVACVDPPSPTLSFKHKVQDGVTYFLVVDGYQAGESGPFTLEVGATIEVEICDNMMDDNGDNLTDCEDPSCAADMACTGPITTACGAAVPITPGMLQVGDTLAGTNLFSGTCCGFGSNEVLYSYTSPQDQIMSVTMLAASDLGLYLRTSCEDFFSQQLCRDTEVGGMDELLFHAFVPAAAPVTLFVDGFMPGNEGPFSFTAETADINETEPNDDAGNANPFMMSHTGYLTAGDNDYIAITLPNAGDLTVSTADVFPGDCNTQLMDTEIELFDTDGVTSLDWNEDIELGNYCSTITAMGLAAGTYYVRVSTSQMFCQGCTTGYRLEVETN